VGIKNSNQQMYCGGG